MRREPLAARARQPGQLGARVSLGLVIWGSPCQWTPQLCFRLRDAALRCWTGREAVCSLRPSMLRPSISMDGSPNPSKKSQPFRRTRVIRNNVILSKTIVRHLTKAEVDRARPASPTRPKTERVSVICDAHGFHLLMMGRIAKRAAGGGQTVWLGSGAAGRAGRRATWGGVEWS